MKKKIALLLGALLLLTGVFAACSNTATSKTVRWSDKGETYTFNINLADFVSGGTEFNAHDVTITKEDGTESTIKCYRDIGTVQEAAILSTSDEIRPIDAKGTYTMNITLETSSTFKLVTEQVLYSQYETATLEALSCLDEFKGSEYDVTNKEENPFDNNSGSITLRSKTTSTVIFANNANQVPTSSVKESNGFYIGKIHQGASNYKYETTYDFENRKALVKKNDGEVEERKLGVSKGGACIDSAQILLYLRSIDKSSSAFADSPAVAVYDPVSDSLSNAVFALTREFNAFLNNNGTDVAASVNAVYVTVGGRPFITQFNLSDLSEKNLDILPATGAGKTCKYTTIKFRSAWYSYELNEYSADIISAISM